MKLTACLIVRNEKDHIDAVLSSLAGIDEIVVVDTGSIDNTVELARKYTDKVFTDYVWNDHFAEARNHALAKCTGDWVLSIDGDEILEPGGIEKIRTVIASATPEQKAFSVRMTSMGAEHHVQRLFRREDAVWEGRAHETVRPRQSNLTDITITYGHSTAHKLDPDRMVRLLEKSLRDKRNARDLYYLGREYFMRRQYDKAIPLFFEQVHVDTWAAQRADGFLSLARCYWFTQKGDLAREACLKAIQLNPDFKEALHLMAKMHYSPTKEKWEKIAMQATNKDVLFIRATPKKIEKPLDMSDFDLQCFKKTLLSYDKPAVLEWGSGNSTKYFTNFLQENGKEYTWEAVEHHKGWHDAVKGWKLKGVEVCFAAQNSPEYFDRKGKYDVIFVDGRNRRKCLIKAKELLKEGGVVLLHDADREYYHSGFEGYQWKFLNPQKGAPRIWEGRLTPKTTGIPKIIHQIWIGPKQRPEAWMNSWKEKNPSFEYVLWDDKKIDELGLKNREIYDRYYADKCFNGCANIARTEILERFGGVFLDADSECLIPLESAPFMDWDIFSVFEADDFFVEGKRLVANGIMAAIPNHPTIIEYREKQGLLTDIHPSWRRSGPLLWTAMLKDVNACLPPYTFLPVHHSGKKNRIEGPVYSQQFWGTSKGLYTEAK